MDAIKYVLLFSLVTNHLKYYGRRGYKQSYKNCEFATKSSKIFLKSQVVLWFMFERFGPYE